MRKEGTTRDVIPTRISFSHALTPPTRIISVRDEPRRAQSRRIVHDREFPFSAFNTVSCSPRPWRIPTSVAARRRRLVPSRGVSARTGLAHAWAALASPSTKRAFLTGGAASRTLRATLPPTPPQECCVGSLYALRPVATVPASARRIEDALPKPERRAISSALRVRS